MMDKNLKLAIIGSLISEGLYSFSVEDFFMNNLKKAYDVMGDYNYEPLKELEQYFDLLDLTALEVNKLRKLEYYAGCDIVHCVWNQWDGEDDYFDILSLDGIEICSSLEVLDIDILSQVEILNPLKKLKSLKRISIINNGENKTETSLEALGSLKYLEALSLTGFKINTSSPSCKALLSSVDHDF